MSQAKPALNIVPHTRVNGLTFGASPSDLFNLLGEPDQALHNYTGELEIRYGETFYRFFAERFVEGTFPDAYRFIIDDLTVLSVFEWLQGVEGTIDKARFRISLSYGLAYDYRNPQHGSLTIFERGRWDQLVLG